ncbi:MAG: ABC transporter permease [Clostridiaceae bacterium]|nr:ABC transporter permease [Clostridiaceae bacterium]
MKNRAKLLAYPYIVWMAIFIVIPLLLVFFYSITSGNIYEPSSLSFTLEHYSKFFDMLYLNVIWKSFRLAIISTVLCLVLGYPVAYIISKSKQKHRSLLLLFFLLPIWMNFLLRTYAWMAILSPNGFLNKALEFFGLPPIEIMPGQTAVVLGMIYNFLPFMVLPIYTVLSKIDKNVLEAAADLGANSFITFIKIILPLSVPGIVTGITMVFMPAVSTFVISRLLGGGKELLIGNLIEQQFTIYRDWHFGSALSIILMIMILVSMAIMSKVDNNNNDDEGRTAMW